MSDDGTVTIPSYRVCFSLERRIHKVDRWRIPVPFGVPVRGIGYAAALLAGILVLGSLPLLGPMVAAIHPAIRFVVAPCCVGFLLYRCEIDGRPAHIALLSVARLHLRPQRIVAFRRAIAVGTVVRLGEVALAPDESAPRLRRGRVRGPATIVLRYPFDSRTARRTLHVSQAPGGAEWRGKQITLRPGQCLVAR
jgi:hypothetical protein